MEEHILAVVRSANIHTRRKGKDRETYHGKRHGDAGSCLCKFSLKSPQWRIIWSDQEADTHSTADSK